MFYTSVTEINSQTYIRGYDNSNKRFKFIRGFIPKKHPLSEENLKFANDCTRLYFRKSEYLENKSIIIDFLENFAEENQKFVYRIDENCQLKNIFEEDMVELEFTQNQLSSLKWQWTDELKSNVCHIQLWDDISTDIKYIHAMKKSKNWNPDFSIIRIGYIDIETECENGFVDVNNPQEKINVISIKIDDKIYVWHIGQFETTDKNVISYKFSDEKEMLEHFFRSFDELDLDILSGWNIRAFDIPCIVNRYIVLNPKCINKFKTKSEISAFSELAKLSPFRIIKSIEEEGRFGSNYKTYEFIGVEILDYMLLYMKYIFTPRSSYALNYICQEELGTGKLDYSEYGTLHNLYQKNFQKFVEYNIIDSDLIQRLENKLGLIQLVCELGYYSGLSFKDVKSPVKTWDGIIYNYLKNNNKVTNPVVSYQSESYPGAYVKPTTAGIYKWIVSFDVNSLYPSIIRQVNLSPETIQQEKYLDFRKLSTDPDDEYKLDGLIYRKDNLDWLKERKLSLSANGNLFKIDKQGVLPYLTEKLYADRAAAKKEMKKWKQVLEHEPERKEEAEKQVSRYNNEQMARKILLNSLYGASCNRFFRFYNLEIGKSITLTGQVFIKYAQLRLNEFINEEVGTTNKDYCALIDTDSTYMDLSKIVEKYNFDIDSLDKFVQEKVEPYLENCFKEMQEYMNHYQPVIAMKRECIADKSMFLSRKKRYALRVLDNEGLRYEHPKLKITGLEVIKSSTPSGVKSGLKGILDFVIDEDRIGLIKYIEKEKEKFMAMELDEIAIPRSITKYDAYTEKGIQEKIDENARNGIYRKVAIPIHNRAANLYNKLIDKLNLNKEYQKIKSGDKIKMIFLTPDNPYGDNVIAYLDRFPKEFGLEEYIDKETIFQKMFIDIVHNITDDFNWNLVQEFTLDDF